MFEFNSSVKKALEIIKEKTDQKTIGTEFLLETLNKDEDGIIHFLMKEYSVLDQELEDETKKMIIFRKDEGEYTKELLDIFKEASRIAMPLIGQEHILYAVLKTKNSIAYEIIKNLGIVPEDLLIDLKEIYDFNQSLDDIKYTKNLTKKARDGALEPLIGYENYLKKIEIILSRKLKNNPLIIGKAGVGKTKLVEGFALYSLKENLGYEILELNLTEMLANTKYRGDFEGRIEEVIELLKKNENIILFVDEIHTIVGAGSSENSLDVANILKPYLARKNIKMIGSTTIEEYFKTIEKDKALKRRFESFILEEPSLEETKKIVFGLKDNYESFHNVRISDDNLNYLCDLAEEKLINKTRPDKMLDFFDLILSKTKIEGSQEVLKTDILAYMKDIEGFNPKKSQSFKKINQYTYFYSKGFRINSNYLYHFSFEGSDLGYMTFIKELLNSFGFNKDRIFEIDLKNLKSSYELLGYSYEFKQPAPLVSFLKTYPMAILSFKNLENASFSGRKIYEEIVKKGYLETPYKEKLYTKNMILVSMIHKKSIGFLSENDYQYDEDFKYYIKEESIKARYENNLKKEGIIYSFEELDKKAMNDLCYLELMKKENR